MILLISLAAVLFSAVLLALIAWRDPKRLRSMHHRGSAKRGVASTFTRRLLGWLVMAPGVVLAIVGLWTPFLIWLGITCTLGWVLAQLLAAGFAGRPGVAVEPRG